jgi:hypothetical protein
MHGPTNPVAKIYAEHPQCGSTKVSHFDQGVPKQVVHICVGCRVELRGKNAKPEWTLFNGSIGTVVDIVYENNKSPNNHDLPEYVLVDFPLYCGPALMEDHPTIVALAPMLYSCSKHCCQRKQIPLALAFGKTKHTLQGTNVGESKPGQAVNPIKTIIADIGNKGVEGQTPDMAYALVARGTTLGNADRTKRSAIYFTGTDAVSSRFQDLNKGYSREYVMFKKQQAWLTYVQNNTKEFNMTADKQDQLHKWYTKETLSSKQLDEIINRHL